MRLSEAVAVSEAPPWTLRVRAEENFLKGAAVAGAGYASDSRGFAGSHQVSVIVVGAGAFGGWSALQLVQRGAKVTLLDAWGPGNSRASSGGETRTIRATYGPAQLYTRMVARALQLWQEYEQRWNVKLFFRVGALRMAGIGRFLRTRCLAGAEGSRHSDSRNSLSQIALSVGRRSISMDVSWSIYEPDSGYLAARRACEAVLDAFLKGGGQYRQVQAAPGPIASNRMQGISVDSR